MSNIEPVVDAAEFQKILTVSESTFFRWLKDARKGIGTLPLPLNTGHKRRLLWSRAAIEEFLNNRDGRIPTPSNFMTGTERRKRNGAACQSLKAMGVKINPNQKEH